MSKFASDTHSNTVPQAWADYAHRLARWAEERLVNRVDGWVEYIHPDKRNHPDNKSFTVKQREVTLRLLEDHFRGVRTIGLHTTTPPSPGEYGCSSKWGVLDHDNHDGGADRCLSTALEAYDRALPWGGLLLDSNGAGGYHNWVLFTDRRPTEHVYEFMKWLGDELEPVCEHFPKQAQILPDGWGNVVRLPGRHHTRLEHWTRVWDGSAWLEGEAAIRLLLASPGTAEPFEEFITDAAETAARLKQEKMARRRASFAFSGGASDEGAVPLASLRDALSALVRSGAVDRYDRWIGVGAALHDLGDEGLALWDQWSQAGASYEPGLCEAKWASFAGRDGYTFRSIFHWATEEAGWVNKGDKWGDSRMKQKMQEYAAKRAQRNEQVSASCVLGEAPDEEADDLTCAGVWTLRNFERGRGEGGQRGPDVSLRTPDIEAILDQNAEGWPRRTGTKLFVPSKDMMPQYLDSSTKFFAWADRVASVDWRNGSAFVTQERFFESLLVTRENYDSVEPQPHWPRLPGIYYMHSELPEPTGVHLEALLDRFTPATAVDRELIRAFILTIFWGGAPGSRPAFLITGPGDDQEGGRGIGKSTLVDVLADELAGGSLDVAQGEDMGSVRTRMLSPQARGLRVARLDNIKTMKLSWADLEAMITATTISGKELYCGEGRRPNTFTWALTQNGGALSKDMAQRVIIIKLERPEHKPDWENEIIGFVRANRLSILADVGQLLQAEVTIDKAVSRWGAWERGVLARCGDLAGAQRVIMERQGLIDDDTSEKELVVEHFRHLLAVGGQDPDTCQVFLSGKQACEWLREALNKQFSTTAATTFLKGLAIPELQKSDRGAASGGRGWLWTGASAGLNLAANTPTGGEKRASH